MDYPKAYVVQVATEFTRLWSTGDFKGLRSLGGTRETMVACAGDAVAAGELAKHMARKRVRSMVGGQFEIIDVTATIVGGVAEMENLATVIVIETKCIF